MIRHTFAAPTHSRPRLLAAPITLAMLACCLIAHFFPQLAAALQWERDAAWQLWRTLTGHLAHWDSEHLFWDATMFAVLGWMLETRNRRSFLLCLITAAVAIPAALWITQSDLATYRGLSGLDTALFAMLATELLLDARKERPDSRGRGGFSAMRPAAPQDPRPKSLPDPVRPAMRERLTAAIPAMLLIGLMAKVGYEYVTGQTLFVNAEASGFTPVPLAHLIGALIGLAVAMASSRIRRGSIAGAAYRSSTRLLSQFPNMIAANAPATTDKNSGTGPRTNS